jgi:hypothetical protein
MSKRQKSRFTAEGCLVIVFIAVAIFAFLGPGQFLSVIKISVIIAAIIACLIITYLYLKKRHIRKTITSEIDKHLRKALEIMDTTAKWYNDEKEANRELVTCLKAWGVEAVLGYRLPNGRIVDAKVGDFLIEGKVAPDTSGVDRLIGQLSDYTQYGNKLNVVIYGWLSKEARKRIENEILQRYANKVFLTYLDNPERQ